jgi:hypothetical protein
VAESNTEKWSPGRVGARGRGRGFEAARPARREGIGKGGAADFAPKQRESGDGVRPRLRGRREKERGSGVARRRVERRRRGGGGPGGRHDARQAEAGAGRRHVSRGGGGWCVWAVRGGVGRSGRGESWAGLERNGVIFLFKTNFQNAQDIFD